MREQEGPMPEEEEVRHRGGRHKGHRGKHHHHHGAQTFRRGRATQFLERLHVRRDTLRQQLDAPELAAIRQVVLGELKAIELVIEEYVRHFELNRAEEEAETLPQTEEPSTAGGDDPSCGD
ncbi:hypothetical protein PCCS19_57570 [Paenibacillus sp. CCS19]|uniref:hypothetical protein n=1 Tax=Paenibacillus sp. CCS19 TaxID=3158387 RepID=UPI00255D780D|nr:hypothetical protein [Paenibacillus cellulosilyticus]GMK42697.1 hypothetical protein PCCS19_57570 [Paenibacillus cellulosilyticus]